MLSVGVFSGYAEEAEQPEQTEPAVSEEETADPVSPLDEAVREAEERYEKEHAGEEAAPEEEPAGDEEDEPDEETDDEENAAGDDTEETPGEVTEPSEDGGDGDENGEPGSGDRPGEGQEDTGDTAEDDTAADGSGTQPAPGEDTPAEDDSQPWEPDSSEEPVLPDEDVMDDAEASENDAPSTAFDVTPYAERLREIGTAQKKLDEQIKEAENDISKEKKLQKAVSEKLGTIEEKISVLNSYITRLEISISDNRAATEKKQKEIDESIEKFKRRLRALYIAGGEEGYVSVLLSSSDFYDVLMRMELVKRVAEHDDRFISELHESKRELEKMQEQLDAQQAEYDRQMKALTDQRTEYNELLAKHTEVRKNLEKEKKELEEKNKAYIEERKAFEADLSGLLKSDYGESSGDTAREAAELEANAALKSLHEWIEKRIADGEELKENECVYEFEWSAPGVYYISYGVGARWGSYHQGIDISGDKGDEIVASETGKVVRINTSCPHDYGKSESCGCGGGYGNYIILDHGNGFLTLYGHLTKVDVEVGDVIPKGGHLGLMGSTGFSTGDHLHFEIRYKGMYLNPAAYVKIRK